MCIRDSPSKMLTALSARMHGCLDPSLSGEQLHHAPACTQARTVAQTCVRMHPRKHARVRRACVRARGQPGRQAL
eukprot:5943525-Alexandrium_andersonii.AAC.1